MTFLIHSFFFFILIGLPWKKENVAVEKIFAVQMVELSRKPVRKIPARTHPPEMPVQKRPETSQPARIKLSRPETEPGKTRSFSSEDFKERLAAKIEKADPSVPKEGRQQRQPVEIEKIDTELIEVAVPRLSATVPEWYIMLLQKKIRENWAPYNTFRERKTTVSFRVSRAGVIENISMEAGSGNGDFDKSVVDAVKSTKDLPVFPEEIRQPYLEIVIEFSTEG